MVGITPGVTAGAMVTPRVAQVAGGSADSRAAPAHRGPRPPPPACSVRLLRPAAVAAATCPGPNAAAWAR